MWFRNPGIYESLFPGLKIPIHQASELETFKITKKSLKIPTLFQNLFLRNRKSVLLKKSHDFSGCLLEKFPISGFLGKSYLWFLDLYYTKKIRFLKFSPGWIECRTLVRVYMYLKIYHIVLLTWSESWSKHPAKARDQRPHDTGPPTHRIRHAPKADGTEENTNHHAHLEIVI